MTVPSDKVVATPRHLIRHALPQDRELIVDFIARYWRADHALVRDQALFDLQHSDGQQLHFVLGFDREHGELLSLQGYIVSNQSQQPDLWGGIWMVAPHAGPGIGLMVHEFTKKHIPQRTYSAIGVNPNAAPVHRRLGHQYVYMDHFYQLGSRASYKIAKVVAAPTPAPQRPQESPLQLLPITEPRAVDWQRFWGLEAQRVPVKDSWYFMRRYVEHPVYHYRFDAVTCPQEGASGVFISREIQQSGAKVLRIIDYVGCIPHIGRLAEAFAALIAAADYEYVDVYCRGIAPELWQRAGFVQRTATDPNIIPNYFEPFEQRNIDVGMISSDVENVIAFKGDGDQDRPS